MQEIATAQLRVNCQFASKCGAALVMYRPQISCLPRDQQLVELLKNLQVVLKEKYIVTEVISCPAYVMVMSSQSAL